MGKLVTLREAAALVADGSLIGSGGNLLHRGPFALVRELARQGRRDLEIVKTAGGYDIDLLSAAGCLRAVSCGFAGFENEFGMARGYRAAVENGRVEAKEHACYTVIQGLRAAAFGLPFMPAAGFAGSDLPAQRGFLRVRDPYSDVEVLAIPPIRPDWVLLHVPAADEDGHVHGHGRPRRLGVEDQPGPVGQLVLADALDGADLVLGRGGCGQRGHDQAPGKRTTHDGLAARRSERRGR